MNAFASRAEDLKSQQNLMYLHNLIYLEQSDIYQSRFAFAVFTQQIRYFVVEAQIEFE